jgi:hypothetical protein
MGGLITSSIFSFFVCPSTTVQPKNFIKEFLQN